MNLSQVDQKLKDSQSWQQSLQMIESYLEGQDSQLNYAAIARHAGIKSRSYVRMVFLGSKKPTLSTFESILAVLKISRSAKKFILLQMQLMQLADQPSKQTQLQDQIEKIRTKLGQSSSAKARDKIYTFLDAPTVFASLGRIGSGVEFDEISKKTNLSPARIKTVVDALVEEGVATLESSRVRPLMNQLVMEKDSSSTFFKNFYFECLRKSQMKATREFSNKENLFSSFAVSIDPEKQKLHADKLYNLLVDFLAEIEDPDGKSVVIINAALHRS